jgi:hypothetical protein
MREALQVLVESKYLMAKRAQAFGYRSAQKKAKVIDTDGKFGVGNPATAQIGPRSWHGASIDGVGQEGTGNAAATW